MRSKMKFVVVLLAAFSPLACRSTCWGQEPLRRSVFDAVKNDLQVVGKDLELRAVNNATSKYASAVARLEMETVRAQDLLREKARAENTDLAIYDGWIRAANAAHDAKLIELGVERDEYLRTYRQRYETLYKDAEAIQALKDQERRLAERRRCESSFFRRLLGVCDYRDTSLDVGSLRSLGTLAPAILP